MKKVLSLAGLSAVMWVLPAGGAEPLRLSLRQMIESSLAKNLDLKISSFSVEESSGRFLREQGSLDWNLSGSAGLSRTTTPASSSLDGVSSGKYLISSGNTVSWTLQKELSFGPKLNLEYDLSKSDTNSTYVVANPSYNASFSAELSLPVLKVWTPSYFAKSRVQSGLDWKNAELRYGEKLSETILRTIELWLEWEQARKEVVLKERAFRNAEETMQAVRSKRRSGTASLVEELDATSAESRAHEALLRAQEFLKQKSDEVSLHVLSDPHQEIEVSGGLDVLGEESLRVFGASPVKSLGERSEAVRASQEVERAGIGKDAAAKDLYPDVSLTTRASAAGLGSDVSSAHSPLGSLKYPSYSVGVSVAMPLLRSAARGTVKSAESTWEIQKLRHLQVLRKMELEQRRLRRQLESSEKRIVALKKAVKAEAENVEAKMSFHRHGRIPTAELNRTLEDKLQAELELLKAQVDQYKAFYSLAKAEGRLEEVIKTLP